MSAIEKVDTGGVSIPPALRGTGIRVVERDGVRSVAFTPEVFEKFNVVSPTSEISALDPLWKPSLAVIQLNPATHGYAGDKKGETALAKNGILALADGAGIQIKTRRMKRDELRDSEIGWTATALVRQTGGTFKELEQSKVIDLDHERDLITDQVMGQERTYAAKDSRQPDMEKAAERARQRWLKERPHMDAKCETKAMLRAIRAAMQLRHALPTEQFSKPWIVVKIGFSPDYDDPQVKRQAIDAGLGAQRQLFGTPAGELAAAPDVYDQVEDVPDAHVVEEPEPAAPVSETGDDATAAPDAGEAGSDDGYDQWREEQETAAAPADAGATSSWQSIIESTGPTQIQFGKKMKGLCIGDAFNRDASYLQWLIGSQFTPTTPEQERVKAHARDFLQAAAALGMVGGTGDRS